MSGWRGLKTQMKYLAHAAIFTLFFDFYFSLEIFSGGEGRLSQGVNEQGHYSKDTLNFRIKIADIILFFLIIGSFLQNKYKGLMPKFTAFIKQLFFFAVYSVVLLLLQLEEISSAQMAVALIYLTKLICVCFYYLFFYNFFSAYTGRFILQSLVVTSLFASAVGILSSTLSLPIFISNRVEYYGQILLVDLLLFSALLQKETSTKSLAAVSRPIAILTFIVGVASIVLCGKRAPLLGLVIGCGYLTLKTMRARQNKKKVLAMAAMAVVGLFFFTELVSRTFVGTAPITDGLDPRYADSLRNSGWASGLSGFDLSTSERIAKIVYSLHLVSQHPIGIGFWSSTFRYDFLPDSGLQFVLENGWLMAILVALKVLFLWKELGQGINRELDALASAMRAMVLALLLVSLTVNVLYMFKIMSVFFIMVALFHARISWNKPRDV